MVFRSLNPFSMLKSEPNRKPRRGICAIGRPSRFQQEDESEDIFPDEDSLENSSTVEDGDDALSEMGLRNKPQSSAVDSRTAMHGENFDAVQKNLQDMSNRQPGQAFPNDEQHRMILNMPMYVPSRHSSHSQGEHSYMEASGVAYPQVAQASDQLPSSQIPTLSSGYRQVQDSASKMINNDPSVVVPQVALSNHQQPYAIHVNMQPQVQHNDNMPAYQYNVQMQNRAMMNPMYSNGNSMQQGPLGMSQTRAVIQSSPIHEVDLSRMDMAYSCPRPTSPHNVRAKAMQTILHRTGYPMTTSNMIESDSYAESSYDMQAAMMRGMANQYQPMMAQQDAPQVKYAPQVNSMMRGPMESQQNMAAPTNVQPKSPSMAYMQRQMQNQQMQEAYNQYQRQASAPPPPNQPVEPPINQMSYQHSGQSQYAYQQQPVHSYTQQTQYKPAFGENQRVQPGQSESHQPQSPNQPQYVQYSKQTSGHSQQIPEPSPKSKSDDFSSSAHEDAPSDDGNIGRVAVKILTVSVRKKSTNDRGGDNQQDTVIKREITLYKLMAKPELLEIEAFLSVEECYYVINFAHEMAPFSQRMKDDYITTIGVAENDQYIMNLRARAAKCLDEEVRSISNPLIYRFDAVSEHAIASTNIGPAFEPEVPASRTLLVYLNGDVEGGELEMTNLGIAIVPKQGYALSWRSIGPDGQYDYQTYYQNSPIIKGTLYCLVFYVSHNI